MSFVQIDKTMVVNFAKVYKIEIEANSFNSNEYSIIAYHNFLAQDGRPVRTVLASGKSQNDAYAFLKYLNDNKLAKNEK